MSTSSGEEAPPPQASESVLADMNDRLRRWRRVAVPGAPAWGNGMDLDFLAELIAYWVSGYDWRIHERRIRSLPWRLAERSRLRLVDTRPDSNELLPVVLLHGWPDSVLRFERLFPLLSDQRVIAPALPGFPFSVPDGVGHSSAQMAMRIADGLSEIGVPRYVLSCGDVGTDVAEVMAAAHPDRVAAIHLTDVTQYRFLVDPPEDLDPVEQAYMARGRTWQETEAAYSHEQASKPATLAAALGDSPAGLAAWIVEKLRRWTDCDGDVTKVFSVDEMLTWVTAYWVTGTIGTSFGPYFAGAVPPSRIQAPSVFTIPPRDLVNAPRRFAERFFDVRSWTELPAGGHFAAWEQPEAYAEGVRRALAEASRR